MDLVDWKLQLYFVAMQINFAFIKFWAETWGL